MRIAAAQVAPASTREDVLSTADWLASAASAAGANLLVLPQRFLAGTAESESAIATAAEPSDGPGPSAMRALAAELGIAMVYGYVERCTGIDYDSLQLVDGAGTALANYRRAHLDRHAERERFGRGQWLSCMPLAGRRLGLLSGYDLEFPEAARALCLIGCDFLAVAGASGVEPERVRLLLAARAAENHCALAYASADPAVPAMVLDRTGRALARVASGTPLITADLGEPPPPAPALRDRRPRLYQRITAVTPADADTPL
jgi:5-aminopentanamidase